MIPLGYQDTSGQALWVGEASEIDLAAVQGVGEGRATVILAIVWNAPIRAVVR